MSPDRWEDVKTNIKKNFSVEEEGVEDVLVDTAEGRIKQGEAEFLIFDGPMGRMKLQFQKKPKLEEKEYHYSHRSGTAAQVEYKFSEDEVVYTFKAYKWDDIEDEWIDIDASSFE